MKKRVSAALFVGSLLVFTAGFAIAGDDAKPAQPPTAATPAPAPAPAPPPAATCVASTVPAEAPHGGSATFTAKLSASIGKVSDVRIQPESKATIGNVVWDAANPNQVQFKADLTAAAAGSWTIEFVGADGTCHGTLRVTE